MTQVKNRHRQIKSSWLKNNKPIPVKDLIAEKKAKETLKKILEEAVSKGEK